MRSKLAGYVLAVAVGLVMLPAAVAEARNKQKASNSGGGDKTIDKQMEWEKKVMGDDQAKQSEMRKIAAAQKLADDAAKNPQPVQAPRMKDPNKEGVRAKQEASIGLPIASDNDVRSKKSPGANAPKKNVEPPSSANDELGALVATSLAQERSADANTVNNSRPRANRTKGAGSSRAAGKGRAKAAGGGGSPSSLDKMFAASGD